MTNMMKWKYREILLCFCIFVLYLIPSQCSRPCSFLPDTTYNGKLLNCSGTGMTSEDIKHLTYPNVTTLILSHNGIGTLINDLFVNFTHLKRIECESCNLNELETDALRGQVGLHTLSLRVNSLKIIDYVFPVGFFRHVPRLQTLYLDDNQNSGYASNYSEYIDIFDSLPELRDLTIDSFSNLTIGEEFTMLENLNILKITCRNLVEIKNDSFKGFETSTVKHLVLNEGPRNVYDQEDCDMLFQYLPNISSLTIQKMMFGNIKVLKMLQPLQGKQIDLLNFDDVSVFHATVANRRRLNDCMITDDAVQFLKHVCVSHFVWLNNYAIDVEFNELANNEWRHCLRSFTFVTGGTTVIVNFVTTFLLTRFRRLESFIYSSSLQELSGFNKDIVTNYGSLEEIQGHIDDYSVSEEKSGMAGGNGRDNGKIHLKTDTWQNRSFSRINKRLEVYGNHNIGLTQDYGISILNWPPLFKILVLDKIGGVHFTGDDVIITKNTMQFISIRNAQTSCTLHTRVLGLDELQSFDLTGSALGGEPSFFKWFPKLKNVIMKATQQISTYYSLVAENVDSLEYFDIAGNDLKWLPDRMLHSNKHIRYLNLASNQFGSIPIDLGLTPNLNFLDLRKNSIVLKRKDIQSIDNHLHHVINFTLLLSNNQISCGCSALPFLRWLHSTTTNLDKGGNYTCMTEEGTLSHTALFSDVKSFWRKCYGPSYLLISLILMSSLVAISVAAFLIMKRKTQILSSIMQRVVPGFKLMTREDFNFDVVIGYADQDVDFVRDVLLRYLEDMWHLNTFVHQRDLSHDPLMMSQAIRDSWRNLLLITENFLDHHPMAHNVMKVCTFFVHASNPRSVIVMVEESVRHRIPDYVLQVVDEDNIIVLSSLQGWLDYETKETLKTRIF